MSLRDFFPFAPRPAARVAPRRRSLTFRPGGLEGLEDRIVLSQATLSAGAPAALPGQVHELALRSSARLNLAFNVTGVNITSITRDATTGVLSLAGTATGTLLGQTFTAPLAGTLAPGATARGGATLNLGLQPIGLQLAGLNLNTSGLGLRVSARPGAAGGALNAALKGALAAGNAAQLSSLLSGPQVLASVNRLLGQATARVAGFNAGTANAGATLALSLASGRLTAGGATLRLSNPASGPITVQLATPVGGNLLQGVIAGGSTRALTREVSAALQQIAATGLPSLVISPPGTGSTTNTYTGTTASLSAENLITLDLKPLDVNLLGLEVKTSEIIVTVSASAGSGKLLGNLLTTVSGLINLQGVNTALNSVLASVVNLANGSSLSVTGVDTGGALGNSTAATTTSVLTAHVAPVHLDLLGAKVDTNTIDVSIVAHSGTGQVLGNVIADLANLLNTPPAHGQLDVSYLVSQVHNLNALLNQQIPGIAPAPTTPPPAPNPSDGRNVLHLSVAPINLNLLGLVLQTDQITVNADAHTGGGKLLGNLLSDLLNTLNATPQNLADLNTEVNNLLAKVVGVLNATNLVLPPNAVSGLSATLQRLALPDLVNTSGTSDSVPVLNLDIASMNPSQPPVDVNLLGLEVTTSDIHARLSAHTGQGQVLGNLVYNVSHLLDPGGALGLLTILNTLGL